MSCKPAPNAALWAGLSPLPQADRHPTLLCAPCSRARLTRKPWSLIGAHVVLRSKSRPSPHAECREGCGTGRGRAERPGLPSAPIPLWSGERLGAGRGEGMFNEGSVPVWEEEDVLETEGGDGAVWAAQCGRHACSEHVLAEFTPHVLCSTARAQAW